MARPLMLALLLPLLTPASSALAETVLYITSSPNSISARGATELYHGIYAYRQFDYGAYSNSVHFDVISQAELVIGGPNLTAPTVGFYPDAVRWPFNTSVAGLDFNDHYRGANTINAVYTVLQADYNPDGSPAAFAIDFFEYEDGDPSAWVQGALRYNSTIPLPEPATALLPLALLARRRRHRAG